MQDTCGEFVGIVLASPEYFSITFVRVLSLETFTTPELLLQLISWLGLDVVQGTFDTVVSNRPRCIPHQ